MYKEEFTKKVLEKTDITKVIGKYTKLEQQYDLYIGKCPFHKDEGMSIVIYPDKQAFHCFDCGKNGNAAVFLMEKEKLSMDQAIEQLARSVGIVPTEQDMTKKGNEVLKSKLYDIYKDAALFYERKLYEQDGADALSYLKGRELSDETMKIFQLGYAPSKGNILYKYLKAKGYDQDLMLQAGLIKISETGPYDMFRGRVMFPIMDNQNRIIAFSGRVMDSEIKPKYLNSPESLIFNKSATLFGLNDIKGVKNNYFLLCEGQMDVISLHQAGIKNSVAGLGTAFTKMHVSELKKHTNNVILSYDGDEAGQKAAMRVIRELDGFNMGIRVLSMDPYKDPDEFIKALGKEEYMERAKRSIDKTDFQLKCFASKYDLSDKEQKHEFLTKAVELIMDKQERQQNKGQKIERGR